jgi:polar amino acid transport system substrate-binding protein
MKKALRFTSLCIPITYAMGLTASVVNFAHADDSLQAMREHNTVKIGYANETPFAYADLNGKVTGESPEIAKIIFAQLGINNVEGVLTEWGSLIPGLRASRFDVITAGMYITKERCKQVLFTDPHYKMSEGLMVKSGNPKKLFSYEDIKKGGYKVAIVSGTVNINYARQANLTDEQILQVPDTSAQLQAVRSGRADSATATLLTLKDLSVKAGGDVELVDDFKDAAAHTDYAALAFRPEDKKLRDAVNVELKKWLGSEEHLATIKPFGFDKSFITQKTAAELCQQ